MKTHTILYKHQGENSDTPKDPVAVKVRGGWKFRDGRIEKVDLKATTLCCFYYDDNRLVSTDLYATDKVTLPDWLSPLEWIRDRVAWKYAWGSGCDQKWPEAWQRAIAHKFGESQRYAAVKLLSTKKFRSPFRQSLHDQLVAWLETPAEARKFDSPFSFRQWEILLDAYTVRAAKSIASGLYYGGRHSGGVARAA